MRKLRADYAFVPDLKKGVFSPMANPCITVDESGKIIAIQEYSSPDSNSGKEDGIEYYNGVFVPGFINAHCHIELSHLLGAFEQASGMSGFINQINALRESVDERGRFEAMKRQFNLLSTQGVVAVSDISNCSESFALKRQFLNLVHSDSEELFPVYYRTFVELFGTEESDAEQILERGEKIAEQAVQMGLKASVTPHSPYTMSPKLLKITALRGLKSGEISYHSQESQEEEDMIMYGTGALAENYRGRGLSMPEPANTTALEYFLNTVTATSTEGLAKIEGRVNLVHNVVLSQRSIDAAKRVITEPFFTVCPLSNIFIHRALPPLDLMRKNNLAICVGTDSLSSNTILSMVEEMRCIEQNFPHIPLGEILQWACLNGAKALGIEERCGSLQVGKTPGIVLIQNLRDFHLTPQSRSVRIV
ncbi:MAG: amidohydrolase family protein [Bacteroidales bacterium]|nr:amidohydrolase family protein [Bacteroidales bacterium]